MIGDGLNHLWQSSVLGALTGLLTIVFRRNRADIRYWLWFAASVKFLVPFALLIDLGGRLLWTSAAQRMAGSGIAATLVPGSQPFFVVWTSRLWSPLSTPETPDWLVAIVLAIWACGCGAIASIRLGIWRRIRAAVRASAPFQVPGSEIAARVQVRSAPGLLEPGVVGWLRPILLVPAGIEDHLTPRQLDAVLTHELCHVMRRDNVTAAIHMISEAVFWFHPLVWWIGARLVHERESACDEEVVRLGNHPRVYAESIVKTCQLYLKSPLACMTGVTGAELSKRIDAIMRNRAAEAVNPWQKTLLGAALTVAIFVPISLGVLSAIRLHAQSLPDIGSQSLLNAQTGGPPDDAPDFCCPDYLAQIVSRIRTNWQQQTGVAATNVVRFTIQHDGRIVDVVLEKSSGLRSLDELSRQALLKTNLLSPLPAAFSDPALTVHLNFAYPR